MDSGDIAIAERRECINVFEALTDLSSPSGSQVIYRHSYKTQHSQLISDKDKSDGNRQLCRYVDMCRYISTVCSHEGACAGVKYVAGVYNVFMIFKLSKIMTMHHS